MGMKSFNQKEIKMNRTMFCCTILITIVSLSIGQERRDVVLSKNGNVIKGIKVFKKIV